MAEDDGWFAAPLVERVGRLPHQTQKTASHPISFNARPYLLFLGLRGYLTFDYAWMFGARADPRRRRRHGSGHRPRRRRSDRRGGRARVRPQLSPAGDALDGRPDRAAHRRPHVGAITDDHIAELLEAIRLLRERPDLHCFYPSPQHYRDGAAKHWITHLHQLQVVLFHRGQLATQPRKLMPVAGSRRPCCRHGCRRSRRSGWPPAG